MGLVWSFDTHVHIVTCWYIRWRIAQISFPQALAEALRYNRTLEVLCLHGDQITDVGAKVPFPMCGGAIGGWIALDKCWGNLWHLWLWNMLNTNTIPKKVHTFAVLWWKDRLLSVFHKRSSFCQKFVSSWKLLKTLCFIVLDGSWKVRYTWTILIFIPMHSYLPCHCVSINSPIPDVHNITVYGARKPGNSASDQSWQFSSCSWCPGSCIVWDL